MTLLRPFLLGRVRPVCEEVANKDIKKEWKEPKGC